MVKKGVVGSILRSRHWVFSQPKPEKNAMSKSENLIMTASTKPDQFLTITITLERYHPTGPSANTEVPD
jgi:hypothetical protein